MRISMFEKFGLTNHYFSKIQKDLAQQQLQLATGKAFHYPSDDPIKANQSLLIRGSQERVEQLQKNVSDAKSFLDRTESVLGSAVEIMQYTREQGLLAASGQHNGFDKETFATIIDKNIEQIVALANTKHMNRYIFSGEKTQTPTYTYDGVTATYNGDTNNIAFTVSDSFDVQVSETGDVAFQDILDSMINLRNMIRTGTDTDIRTAVDTLDVAMNKTIDLRAEMGIRVDGLQILNETYERTMTDLEAKKSQVEDIDLTEVVSKYAVSQQLYQGTVQASVKMLQTSILNFI